MSLRRSWATRAVKLNSERRRAKRSPSFVFGGGVPRILPLALFCGRVVVIRRDASPNARRWQYSRAMRPRTPCRGNFLASCISKAPSDGKSAPPWQHIAAMHPKRAGIGKICAPCIRKAPQIAFRECMARRSCQGGSLFAARTPRIMHTAQILPSVAAEQRERPQPLRRPRGTTATPAFAASPNPKSADREAETGDEAKAWRRFAGAPAAANPYAIPPQCQTARVPHSAEARPGSRRRPSARNSSAVCVLRRRTAAREPPVLDHPIREARSRRLHPIDSWAVGIASSSHGIAAALCRHQPVACRS